VITLHVLLRPRALSAVSQALQTAGELDDVLSRYPQATLVVEYRGGLPLFVSHRALSRYRKQYPATHRWRVIHKIINSKLIKL
jgi:hypothetical protein